MTYPYFKKGSSSSSPTPESWVRPADWLTMPTISDTEEKIAILVAIFDTDQNVVRVDMQGDYTVDWGDGIVESFSSGFAAEHEYDYSNVNLNGSESTRGYKQAIIEITAQSGSSLTNVQFHQPHSSIGNNQHSYPYLECISSLPNCTSILNQQSYGFWNMCERFELKSFAPETNVNGYRLFYRFYNLREVVFGSGVIFSNVNDMYYDCWSIQTVPVISFTGTSLDDHFYYCRSLVQAPLYDTASVTNFTTMFSYCGKITEVPLFDTSSATSTSSMFNQCQSLKAVPLFDMSNVLTCTGMFNACYSLQEVPLLDVSSATSTSSMFAYCYALTDMPITDFSSSTSTASMFIECRALKEINVNISASTSMQQFAYRCYALQRVNVTTTSSLTNTYRCFDSCSSLMEVNAFATTNVTNSREAFEACHTLSEIPALDMSSSTNNTNICYQSYSLKKMGITGIKTTTSVRYCNLSSAALDEIYTNLASGVSGQTITVSNNPGIGGDDPSIATAKGWTVSG